MHQHSVHYIFDVCKGTIDNLAVPKGKLDRLAIKGIKTIQQGFDHILTSSEEIDELRRLVADGWSDRQLAEHFGCCLMTVYNRRREHGIDRAKRVPQDVDSEELRRLVDSGMTDAEIADRLGVSISAEKYYVLKYGCCQAVRLHEKHGGDIPSALRHTTEGTEPVHKDYESRTQGNAPRR